MQKDKHRPLRRLDLVLITVLVLIATALRLYRVDAPLADFHSWRQADTAAVARNFSRYGFDLLHPRYDDLTSIQSGLDNPEGLRFVEFPLYNAMFAGLYVLFPVLPVEVWGRIVSIIMSLLTLVALYYLVYKEINRVAAVATAGIYAVFPYMVFFSRTVLPETTAVGFAILSIVLLRAGLASEKRRIFSLLVALSSISFALAILVKPTAIFYGLVLAILFLRKYGLRVFKAPPAHLYFIMALLPLIGWRIYIMQFPEGIPSAGWLITRVQTFEGERNIFFRPAFFRWVFYERIATQMLGGFAVFFLIMGILAKQRSYLLHTLGLSALIYLLVFQGGNIQHEYYQIILFPALAVLCGLGIEFLFRHRKILIHPIVTIPVVIATIGLSIFFSYYKVKDFYGISGDLVQIANLIKTVTRPEDTIITDRMGDTTLLYLMDRRGSPAIYKDLDEMRKDGYAYLVVQNRETIETIRRERNYREIMKTEKFSLFKL
ncbi:MAG: glycosyltransferase family 39 protein [Patescibacteria group bacterium]|nr:glycosyltransferase family 39 protein [Patescibacteria group bacterium]